MIRLYNTLSREKDELSPIHKDWVGLYTCGPTVYNYAHIGNLRAYIFEDVLERALRYDGYTVRRVMNITDVGHLTGDTDAGDDKLDKAAQAEKKSVEELAKFYTDAFFTDLEKLNIIEPDVKAPATEFIREQIALIETLVGKGFAYDTPTAVYFDTRKLKDYGKLSGQSLDEKSIGARDEVVVDGEKRHPADFALWFKLEGKFKKHLLHWPSPWGEGFPGWHIECSAISRHFLGQPFDIHTGGVDHIGTHHTNEIAQSEAAYGVPLAHIWMHGEHLLIDGNKMAKSEGNFLTLNDLEKKGYHPLAFRYLILGGHYRTAMNFTFESLAGAQTALERLYETVYELTARYVASEQKGAPADQPAEALKNYEKLFAEAINDDLNTPKALAVVYEMIDDHGSVRHKLELIKKFDEVLGLDLEAAIKAYSGAKDRKIVEMVAEYEAFRSNKQFVQSDALRKEIEALGYSVRDTKAGPAIVKIFFNAPAKEIPTEGSSPES